MKKIVFATNNAHKLNEVRNILLEKFEVVGLNDIGLYEEIPETGITLCENASLKSDFVYRKKGIDCFSDDTGLEIDALSGEPGVYSARYAGEEGNAEKNIEKVLTKLHHEKNRKARFRTCVSLIWEGEEFFFEGVVHGVITQHRSGTDGFGYDPVFIPEGYNQTFAEMPSTLKNSISHRGKAIRKLADFLLSREKD